MWLVVLAGFGVIALKVESVLAGVGWQDSTRVPAGQGRHPLDGYPVPGWRFSAACRPADSAVALAIAGGQAEGAK